MPGPRSDPSANLTIPPLPSPLARSAGPDGTRRRLPAPFSPGAAILLAFPLVCALLLGLAATPPVLRADAADSAAADSIAASAPRLPTWRFAGEIGKSGSGPGEFRRPQTLTAAPTGGLLVTDAGNVRIQLIETNGLQRWEAGGAGTDEGSLRRPVAVAASGLEVLILDEASGRVLQFHARGEFLGVALDLRDPRIADELGEIEARGLAVDRTGNLHVTDREGDRLLVFAPNRDLLYAAGGFGDGAQQFEDPESVVAGRSRIFVADSRNGRVQVLDLLGRFQASWPLPGGGRPVGLALDDRGRLYVADAARNRIVVLSEHGTVLAEDAALVMRSGDVVPDAGDGGKGAALRGPSGVCVVEDRLIVADSENDRLLAFAIAEGTN
jgi:sugar lactone lactonase YvrE